MDGEELMNEKTALNSEVMSKIDAYRAITNDLKTAAHIFIAEQLYRIANSVDGKKVINIDQLLGNISKKGETK